MYYCQVLMVSFQKKKIRLRFIHLDFNLILLLFIYCSKVISWFNNRYCLLLETCFICVFRSPQPLLLKQNRRPRYLFRKLKLPKLQLLPYLFRMTHTFPAAYKDRNICLPDTFMTFHLSAQCAKIFLRSYLKSCRGTK